MEISNQEQMGVSAPQTEEERRKALADFMS